MIGEGGDWRVVVVVVVVIQGPPRIECRPHSHQETMSSGGWMVDDDDDDDEMTRSCVGPSNTDKDDDKPIC